MAGPLEGLQIVDCSSDFAGTRATGLLSDYGADVVWVEPPGGSPFRRREAPAASVFNRGKRSVVLDLEDADGGARLLGLLAGADIFFHDFEPAAAQRLGLDYPALHTSLPSLIMCSITGFGPDARYRHLPAREALVHAVVGSHEEQAGHREGPIYQGLPFAAIGASYLAVIGALGAVTRRYDDGIGRLVETSLFDGALAYHGMVWGESDRSLADGVPTMGFRRRKATAATRFITRSYLCADDTYIGLHTGAVGAFDRLMKVLELDHLLPPVEGAGTLGGELTAEQQRVVTDDIPVIFASKPRQHWVDVLMDADVCAVEHLHATEVFDTPQSIHNGMTVSVDDPALGAVEQVAPAATFAGLAVAAPQPAPAPGEHDRELLTATTAGPQASTPAGAVDGRPLFADVKVLDFGAFFAGPYASRLLADLGADVIKVEPIGGDPMRGPLRTFAAAQAGKRFIAANLKDPAARPLIEKLVSWADVVHHNLRPGAAERLGLDYETVRAINPDVVYLHASGWGTTGPYTRRQSFAPMISGYTGVTFEVAGQWNEPMPPSGSEDPGSGLLGACAILMALVHRRRTGAGTYVHCPQLNATMSHMAHVVRRPGSGGKAIGAARLDTLQLGFSALDRLYQTADGWLCLVAREPEEGQALGKVLGVETEIDAGDDDVLAAALAARFETLGTAEVVAELRAASVPVAVPAAGEAAHEVMNDAVHRRLGRTAEVHDPEQGSVREIAVLVRVSDAAAVPHRLAPRLGQHTDEVLAWLGYEAAEIVALRDRGAVR